VNPSLSTARESDWCGVNESIEDGVTVRGETMRSERPRRRARARLTSRRASARLHRGRLRRARARVRRARDRVVASRVEPRHGNERVPARTGANAATRSHDGRPAAREECATPREASGPTEVPACAASRVSIFGRRGEVPYSSGPVFGRVCPHSGQSRPMKAVAGSWLRPAATRWLFQRRLDELLPGPWTRAQASV
jgi:hypothetical protein